MKNIARIAGIVLTAVFVIAYLAASSTAYISPYDLPLLSLISIGYLPILFCYILLLCCWVFINKRIFLVLLLLLFAGYRNLFSTVGVNVFAAKWKWQKDTASLRVMSWNVNLLGDPYIYHDSANSIRQQMLRVIRDAKPDILCVQDFRVNEMAGEKNIFVNNIQDVQQAGPFPYFVYCYYFDYNGPNYCDKTGVAIFSKYPITDTGSVRTAAYTEERACYVQVNYHSKPLRVYTAHLASMSLWPNTQNKAGIRYLEGDSTRIRVKSIYSKIVSFGALHAREADALKGFIDKSPCPFIITADLNSMPSSYVYHHISKGLKDAFLEKDNGIGGTYNRVFPKLRIDVLLHSKELGALQFIRPAPPLSDHYPVIADLEWKE